MKLKAEMAAWSSVVGGGVLLIAEDGRMAGQIAFLCHDDALRDKATQKELARLCCDAINGTRAPLSPAVLAELPEVRELIERADEAVEALDYSATEIDNLENVLSDYRGNGSTARIAAERLRAIAAAIREGRNG